MKYYPDDKDKLWNEENRCVLGYCFGLGLDIGAGNRTLNANMITIDNWSDDVDYKMEADKLDFKDEQFDFVYASHVIEHLKDPLKAIREWLRVVKVGGYIIMIVPDKNFIPTKGTIYADPQHKVDYSYDEFREIVWCLDNAVQVNKNIWALRNYSFLMVLRRIK